MIVERLDPSTTGDVLNRDLHLARYAWAAGASRGGDVLDLACGVGYGSAMLAEGPGRPRVLGLDRSEDALATARDRHADERVSFERIADASALDLGARRFDAVVSLETLEHLDRPLAFLRRAHAHLAPGVLVVSAPTHEAPGDNPYGCGYFAMT